MSDADYISTAPPHDKEMPIVGVKKEKKEKKKQLFICPRQSPSSVICKIT
jgi:hypothetical protein